MENLINIFIQAAFIENMVLAYFLGMCSYLAVSKTIKTSFGLGLAVIFVLFITTPINYLIKTWLLDENALYVATGSTISAFQGLDLNFLGLIIYISVIASMVQLVEMVIEKVSPALYNSLGIFLPLITVNCSILGGTLFMITKEFNLVESIVFGLGAGFGFFLAIMALAAIREKIRYSNIPPALRGLGIAFIITGLMGIAFMSFMGIQLN